MASLRFPLNKRPSKIKAMFTHCDCCNASLPVTLSMTSANVTLYIRCHVLPGARVLEALEKAKKGVVLACTWC